MKERNFSDPAGENSRASLLPPPPAVMSSSRHVSDGVRPAAGEKSNFLQTCNLLSRYIKEKGSLRDLNLEIGGKVESLEAIVKPGSSLVTSKRNGTAKSAKHVEPSPQVPGPYSSIIQVEDAPNKTITSKEGTATGGRKHSQLTIFYSGKVLIFDDFPADKARELVSVAKKSSSQMSYGILPNSAKEKPSHGPRDGLPPRPQSSGATRQQQQQTVGGISSNTCKEKTYPTSTGPPASPSSSRIQSSAGWKEKTEAPASRSKLVSTAQSDDLPIARRSSINRFLEKRKDRAAARGPYQNHDPTVAGAFSKGDEQLDLNL